MRLLSNPPEPFERLIQDVRSRPAFARYVQVRLQDLRRDLADYVRYQSSERAHTGHLTRGRVPGDIAYGAREMEAR